MISVSVDLYDDDSYLISIDLGGGPQCLAESSTGVFVRT